MTEIRTRVQANSDLSNLLAELRGNRIGRSGPVSGDPRVVEWNPEWRFDRNYYHLEVRQKLIKYEKFINLNLLEELREKIENMF